MERDDEASVVRKGDEVDGLLFGGACSVEKFRYGTVDVRGVSRPARTRLGKRNRRDGDGLKKESSALDFERRPTTDKPRNGQVAQAD